LLSIAIGGDELSGKPSRHQVRTRARKLRIYVVGIRYQGTTSEGEKSSA
jgi:hypothetical protein